jgi:hypothetical protein
MTTERLTISFDPEKGQLRITDGRMMSSLGKLVPVMTMSGPADKREELVARFNAARGNWGLPPLPDLPMKPPVSDVPISSSFDTDPLNGKPLRKPQPPKRPASVPQSRTVGDEKHPAIVTTPVCPAASQRTSSRQSLRSKTLKPKTPPPPPLPPVTPACSSCGLDPNFECSCPKPFQIEENL